MPSRLGSYAGVALLELATVDGDGRTALRSCHAILCGAFWSVALLLLDDGAKVAVKRWANARVGSSRLAWSQARS